ncbi:MAG TPA: hypothetical protein ENN69_05610, partial [Spirochaetia bacterium]|nr:hypothetical protein [Spirochaetia bacterium]
GEIIGAYCVVILPDDSRHIEYMSLEEIEDIRTRSKAANTGPWKTDWGQMAIKTVVRRGLKPFAGSPEMQTAIEYDNQAVGLNLPDRSPISEPREIQAEDVTEEPPPEEAMPPEPKPGESPEDKEFREQMESLK